MWEQKLKEQDTYTPDADLKEKANKPKRPRKQTAAHAEQEQQQQPPIPSMQHHSNFVNIFIFYNI